jgi:hypothetical protein
MILYNLSTDALAVRQCVAAAEQSLPKPIKNAEQTY